MQAADTNLLKSIKSDSRLSWLLLLLGSALSILVAFLLVNGEWYYALGALLILPGVILLHRYPWLALVLWLLLAPFLLHTPTMEERRLYWIIHRALPPITLGIIVVSSALKISCRKLPKLGWLELAIGGYMILSLLSIWLFNDDPLATTYLFYDRFIVPICLYLIVRLTIQDGASAQKLLPVVVFLFISQSMIGILSWSFPQLLPSEWLSQAGSRTTGSLVNASVYTTTLTLTGLVLLHASLISKHRLNRLTAIITFCLLAYCIFISFSRASWIGGIVVLLGLLYIYPQFTFKTSIVVLSVLLLSGSWLLSDQIQWAQSRIYSAESERSALSRLPVYQAAYRMFLAKPLTGWGYGNFDRYDRQFQGRVADFASDNKDHSSHNLYLTTIAEQGLVGLGLYLAPIIGLSILTVKTFPQMPNYGFWSRKLLLIFWLVIISYIVVNNFSNMRVVFGLGMWWITLGLIASMIYSQRRSKSFTRVKPVDKENLSSGF